MPHLLLPDSLIAGDRLIRDFGEGDRLLLATGKIPLFGKNSLTSLSMFLAGVGQYQTVPHALKVQQNPRGGWRQSGLRHLAPLQKG